MVDTTVAGRAADHLAGLGITQIERVMTDHYSYKRSHDMRAAVTALGVVLHRRVHRVRQVPAFQGS